MEFLFAILVLFLYAKVLGEIFHHFGFSSLIGEVIVGVVLGPALLGWIIITPGEATSEAIQGVAMLGLIVLMLVAGMNSRFDLLSKLKFKSLAISIPAAVLSFYLAFMIPYALGLPFITSLFIGVALANTGTDILARVMEGHRLQSVVMGAALIDDIMIVYVIGILSVLARQALDISGFLLTSVGIILFFVLISYISRELLVKRDLMRVLWKGEERGVPIAFALILALALAVAAHQIGLHMIIGAYMGGLFISRLRERRMPTLQSRIQLNRILRDTSTSLESVLTPIFFAFVGLQLAPDWGRVNLLLFLGLLFAAFAGKFVGGGLGASFVGYEKERVPIGVAMCSRGALELALLHFGLHAEIRPGVPIISPEVYASMVLLVIVIAILTPVLFKYAAERI
jgi:Kef-type K+ transport system membrane component KefB